MIKFTIFAIALLICATFGAVQATAYAPPKASENVTVKKVQFKNRININVVGNLYTPKNLDKTKKYPLQ